MLASLEPVQIEQDGKLRMARILVRAVRMGDVLAESFASTSFSASSRRAGAPADGFLIDGQEWSLAVTFFEIAAWRLDRVAAIASV